MQLEEKLYTSTEVAEILGVSLRSVYRYLDEDKLQAEVKTATGRHRFTKQNILDFLYPQDRKGTTVSNMEVKPTAKEIREDFVKHDIPTFKEEAPVVPEEPVTEPVEEPKAETESKVEFEAEEVEVAEEKEEPIDWLEKFRSAANKYREEEEAKKAVEPEAVPVADSISGVSSFAFEEKAEEAPESQDHEYYYRSLTGGLKDIAQNIDKSARKASVDYAFTMNAGLSLHKPIKPFSLLHVYVRPEDREFFERMLHLVPAEEGNSQLCLLTSGKKSIFNDKKEMHGLSVVSDNQLKSDLIDHGEDALAGELDSLPS